MSTFEGNADMGACAREGDIPPAAISRSSADTAIAHAQ